MKSLDSLVKQISKWSVERGIDKAETTKQAMKIGEELGELNRGILRQDESLIEDSIGDIFIDLEILCLQLNLSMVDCVEKAYNEIKDRNGKTVKGVYIKEEDLGDENPFKYLEDEPFNLVTDTNKEEDLGDEEPFTYLDDEPFWLDLEPDKVVALTMSNRELKSKPYFSLTESVINKVGGLRYGDGIYTIGLTEYEKVKFKIKSQTLEVWTDSMVGESERVDIPLAVLNLLIGTIDRNKDANVLDVNFTYEEKTDVLEYRVTDGYLIVKSESKPLEKSTFSVALPVEVLNDIWLVVESQLDNAID